jgi:hypothetical protein
MLLSDAKKQIMQWLQEGVKWRRDMAEDRYSKCLDCPHFRKKNRSMLKMRVLYASQGMVGLGGMPRR